MKLLSLSLLLLLAAATVSHGLRSVSMPKVIELATSNNIFENEAELLEKDKLSINYPNCRSWHLGVETSTIIDFDTIPANCEDYVTAYVNSTTRQYTADSTMVCNEAYFYAKGLTLKNDTVNVWIFDLDDTVLSAFPFYAERGWGTKKTPPGAYWKWLESGVSLPGHYETSLPLYKNLLKLGIEPILLTERWTTLKEVTLENLKVERFPYWKEIIFKPEGSNEKQVVYKSKAREDLVKKGYNIVGNIGDYWDIPHISVWQSYPNKLAFGCELGPLTMG